MRSPFDALLGPVVTRWSGGEPRHDPATPRARSMTEAVERQKAARERWVLARERDLER